MAVARVDGLVSQASLPTGVPRFGSDAVIMAFGGTIYTDFPYPPGLFPPNVIQGVGFEDYLVSYDSVPNSTNEDMGLSAGQPGTGPSGSTPCAARPAVPGGSSCSSRG